MKIEPIKVTVKNSHLLSVLLSFVDRDDFLNDISHIREEKLGMSKLYKRKLVEELYKYYTGFKIGAIRKDDFKGVLDRLSKRYHILDNSVPLDETVKKAIEESVQLMRKYNKSVCFMKAIMVAMLCGEIGSKDYSSNTYSLALNPYTLRSELFEGSYDYTAIIISRESTIEEVENVFKQIYKEHFKRKRPIKLSKSERFKPVVDVYSNIVEFRKWYWMHKDVGYRKIAKATAIPLETIISGIRTYSSLIKASK
ncbi:MAG TPA: hypothetical protein VG895_04745 [Patescibacteria group bacterium]|nr:hypothetical protein [Patescibacteria group bacterium]